MSQRVPQNLPFFCLFLLAFLLPCNSSTSERQKHEHKIKGMFVFGSSLVDNGNNNFIKNTIANVDFLPYGIDFPFGPSGRFTNGKNVIDLLGEHLGILSYIPPFTDPSTKGKKLVSGVNYASGGSGILDDTGAFAGNVMNLNAQIRNFESVTLPDLEVQLRSKSRESLPQFLFVVGSGGNDYSLNYFMGMVNSNVSLEEFTANLTTTFSHQLKRLYNLGARKFALMAINPNGCSPMARASSLTRDGCVQHLNRAVHLFNARLKTLVVTLRAQMPGSVLVFVNSYKVIRDIIRDPASKGMFFVS
ncbi:GDSL esterase lipase At1g29670-like [Olea europaea subsp. europaea]|uniref:GDSL esterase lipase At1g29670-like n=1 Tax=Olea europaea subsp. europaea TaxID=158383 RepID=A0A8S0UTX8_OLEEU|nr:GDSL esterase lipase At1g29670-like [Olea europaea subsp. europaea]